MGRVFPVSGFLGCTSFGISNYHQLIFSDMIWKPLFSHPGQVTLSQNNLLTTLTILPREWMGDFMFKPTTYSTYSNFYNILHLTNMSDRNTNKYGGRVPALWSFKEELLIECAKNGFIGQRTLKLPKPPAGKWTQITLSQEYLSGKSRYRVLINGVEKYNVENAQDGQFRDVRVYSSDPWFTAQSGHIKDLSVKGRFPASNALLRSADPGTNVTMLRRLQVGNPQSCHKGLWVSLGFCSNLRI